MMQENIFDTGKVQLNYLDYGNPTAEPMVMLHGGAWCWQEYLSLTAPLAQRWHIYAMDLRGNGRSGWVPKQYRLLDFCDDNAAFLESLQAPAVLVGHSIGGVIALMLAARCPQKVKALILEDVVLTLQNYRRVIDQSQEMFALWLRLKNQAKSETDLYLALAEAYKDLPTISSTWILFFSLCLWRLDPTFFDVLRYDFDRFSEGYDYQNILTNLSSPALFLRGETKLGAVMTDDEISWLRDNCGNAQCACIDGVGHLLHLEDAGYAPVLREMTTFLDRIQ